MITFTVYGVAAPAGSKTVGKTRAGGTFVRDSSKRSYPWKQQVAQAAGGAMRKDRAPLPLLEGPLELVVRFYVPRPKSHIGKRGLLPSAPQFPTVKPDVTKLLRAVEDACTGVVWRDDAQIVVQHATKEYGEPARCAIGVAPIHQAEEAAAA